MQHQRAILKNAWPYQQDKLNLPVENVDSALSFYEQKLGFTLIARQATPVQTALLERDAVQIGLAENGGDPTQDGCFFEVDNVEKALNELKANGLLSELSAMSTQQHGPTSWNVFFVVAPDGLCYCYGQRQE